MRKNAKNERETVYIFIKSVYNGTYIIRRRKKERTACGFGQN